jgi:hypothetical protein
MGADLNLFDSHQVHEATPRLPSSGRLGSRSKDIEFAGTSQERNYDQSADRGPVRVKLRNTQVERMSSALASRTDVG